MPVSGLSEEVRGLLRLRNAEAHDGRRKAVPLAEALEILSDTSKTLKEINPKLEITCCVHATLNTYYVTELRGYDNWDAVAACPYFDVFSTTILNWDLPESFFRDITERTVKTAHKYGKEAERWLMGYNKMPSDLAQIDRAVDLYESLGADTGRPSPRRIPSLFGTGSARTTAAC